MAYAYDTYTASASQTDFTITFPYIEASHVTVYVNGVLQTEGSANDYTIVTTTTVRFNTGLSSGDVVELIRSTSPSTRIVDYASASSLTEDDLDNDSLQAFYMAQEALDDGTEKHLAQTYDGQWDFQSLQSTNVPAPTANDSVATKLYVDTATSAAGYTPIPENPADDNKFLQANGGTFSWVTFLTSMITDVVADVKTFLTSANLADARANLGLGSAALVDAGTTVGEVPLINSDGGMTWTSTDAGAGVGPTLILYRNSASPANNDLTGTIQVLGRNDAAAAKQMALIYTKWLDVTSGSEDSQLLLRTTLAGANNDVLKLGGGLQVGAPTGGDLGVGSINAQSISINNNAVPYLNADGGQTWEDQTAGSSTGPQITFFRNAASGTNYNIAAINFSGLNSVSATHRYGRLYTRILDNTAGSTDSELRFVTRVAGTEAETLLVGNGVKLGSPSGGYLGSGTLNAQAGIYKNNVELPYTDAVQTWTAAQRGEVTALTDAASISLDLSLSNNFSVTLGGNRTLANPTNIVAGQSGLITVTQDGTGSRTLAYGTYYKFAGGTAPTLTTTAGAVDTLAYYVKSSTEILVSATLNWS